MEILFKLFPANNKEKLQESHRICETNAPLEVRMPLSSPTFEFVNWRKLKKFHLFCTRIWKESLFVLWMRRELVQPQEKLKDSIPAVLVPSSWTKEVSFFQAFWKPKHETALFVKQHTHVFQVTVFAFWGNNHFFCLGNPLVKAQIYKCEDCFSRLLNHSILVSLVLY